MLGTRLKHLRKRNNKTQQDIADMLCVTRPTYTAYEVEKRKPDYDILCKIADYYDVSTDYLLGRTDNEYNNLSEKQKQVVDFFLERESLFFKSHSDSFLSALEQFEVYYLVWEKQNTINKK